MKSLTEMALKRPVTTIMIFVTLMLIGVLATQRLSLEFMPEMTGPGMYVEIPYPGSTPEEVERLITKPAEEVLATVSGIKRMESWSRADNSGIFIGFEWGDDVELKRLEIKEKLDGIRSQWPADVDRFFVWQWSSDDWAILNLRISADRDLSDAFDLLNRNLKRPIERVDGVSRVNLYGVEPKEVRIQLLADRIAAYEIDLNTLMRDLRQANFSISAGSITDISTNQRFIVRPVGEIRDPKVLENIIVKQPNIRLKDIAKVIFDQPIREYGRHLDRKYAVGLEIFKENTAKTVEVSERVMAAINEINQNPEMRGIQLFVMNNQAEGITSSLVELLNAGVVGAFMSILVLFYFLRQVSTTLIVGLAVPFSLLITLGFMYFMDMSLNILSMMGLMLAIGMLVDNAVVISENIHRKKAEIANKFEATRVAVKEVALAVTAGTLTTAIVFLPNIIDRKSEISIQLYHVAVTIVISLVASLLLSMTIVPLLSTKVGTPKKKDSWIHQTPFIDWLEVKYERLLRWFVGHKVWTGALILGILGSVAVPGALVRQEMFPDSEQNEIRIFYHIDGQYDLSTVEDAVDTMEAYLYNNQDKFEFKSVYSWFETNNAVSTITLKDAEFRKQNFKQIMEAIRDSMPQIAIAAPTFDWQRENGGAGEQLQVSINGESSDALVAMTKEISRLLNSVPGIKDAKSEAEEGGEEIIVQVDRERARNIGLGSQEVAQMVSAAMRGTNLPRIYTEEGEIRVFAEFDGNDKQTEADLRNMPIQLPNGESIKLSALAQFGRQRGPNAIRHDSRISSMRITMNMDGITTEEARGRIKNILDNYTFPAGYTWSFGQQFDFEQETQDTMLVNLLLALILIYLVMAALFESILYPISIWTSIIFAIVGVFWFFLITDTQFSFMAMIGILVLIGIVVNNGIVLIDYINHLRKAGKSREEAIFEAGRTRLRPILMTAATTILGLLPLCISSALIAGDGPPYFPMARAIVGGLLFSTVITVLILPNIYLMLDDLKIWSGKVIKLAKQPLLSGKKSSSTNPALS